MSHVTVIDIEIKDLGALRRACEDLGLEFREGQTTFKWYGRHVGDYPIPEGYSKEDMGHCEHAIGIPNNKNAYEVGVIRNKATGGWHLMWDFFAGGHGLQKVVGNNCSKLVQGYSKQMVKSKLLPIMSKGFQLKEQQGQNGEIVLLLRRG